MSPTFPYKYKYFHFTVQRAKNRRPKFHFCRLPFDVRPRNVKLNLSNLYERLLHERKLKSGYLERRIYERPLHLRDLRAFYRE